MNAKKTATRGEHRVTIDWGGIKRRLEAVGAAIARGWAPSPEEARKILKARTEALAREPERGEAAGESIEILEFRLAYESYGIESSFVREVCPLKDFTPVPCTPPFVLGIVNVRGQVLSVVDLKKFFELPEKGLSDLNKVIIVHSPDTEFGILADAVTGVRTVSAVEIQPSLPTLTGIRQEYLKGVTGERLVILDGAKLLADDKMRIHEAPGTRTGGP
ncbi:MAG: purine-binding chemotaxis protein CheW [Betaproteobacteria bacterium]|nr:purine-binding chemotaxis protein CheW [Betaproteobacteria bacterium]